MIIYFLNYLTYILELEYNNNKYHIGFETFKHINFVFLFVSIHL